jgi:hypothetical protein
VSVCLLGFEYLSSIHETEALKEKSFYKIHNGKMGFKTFSIENSAK